jgi:vacuolar-type H+-ATPase subunit I/STV1
MHIQVKSVFMPIPAASNLVLDTGKFYIPWTPINEQVLKMVAPGLKDRYVDVYLPSENAKLEWEEEAKKAGLPMSKFVFEAVEAFRAAKDETPRSDMVRELAEAKEETQKLRSELKMKTLLLEKLEADVYKARYANFQEVEMGEGTRRHDQELIKILQRGKALEGYAILKELAIDPSETEAVKLVNNQLESLRGFGLVEETANGWRWIK